LDHSVESARYRGDGFNVGNVLQLRNGLVHSALDGHEDQTCLLRLCGHFSTEGMAIIKFYLLESLPERSRNSNARHYAAKKQPCKFQLARGIADWLSREHMTVADHCEMDLVVPQLSAYVHGNRLIPSILNP